MREKLRAYMRIGNDIDGIEYYDMLRRVQLLFKHDIKHDMVTVIVETNTDSMKLGVYSKEVTEAMFGVNLCGCHVSPPNVP